MTYAFQTPEKLCFILDLMNGGDLHYHLSQHGVFTEKEVRFYAAEVMLGLEHMHSRFVVYRDLKVRLADNAFLPVLLYQQFRCQIRDTEDSQTEERIAIKCQKKNEGRDKNCCGIWTDGTDATELKIQAYQIGDVHYFHLTSGIIL